MLDPYGHSGIERRKKVLIDRYTVKHQDAGIQFLSLKSRLLKCDNLLESTWDDNEIETKSEDYSPVEFLENANE